MLKIESNPNFCALPVAIKEAVRQACSSADNGNLVDYLTVIEDLHQLKFVKNGQNLNASAITADIQVDAGILTGLLRKLHPWRKGPWQIGGVSINTEWRSDWKWERLAPHLGSLTNNFILDIGCGNGYHLCRMAGMGAKLAVGLEPYWLSVMQFEAMSEFIDAENVLLLPLKLEDFPVDAMQFDKVFSMGVIYHCRNVQEHLQKIYELLKPGGMAIVESITIPPEYGEELVPEKRYAKMRNVHHIPNRFTLQKYLEQAGFTAVEIIDECVTSRHEQRSTDWMTFESLPDFLVASGAEIRTVEGYPRPRRAAVIGYKN